MNPYKANANRFILAAVLLTLLSALASEFLLGRGLIALILAPASIVFVVGGAWLIFDRYIWKWRIINLLGFSMLPDLNGTWVGNVNRNDENNPHAFKAVVHQTYSRISITTSSENARGYSVKSFFLCDENCQYFTLVDYWYCKTRSRTGSFDEEFHGVSRIDIVRDPDGSLALENAYFTDRNPATQGRSRLKRQEESSS